MEDKQKIEIAIVHPFLMTGGAEHFIINLATGLTNSSLYNVHMYTALYDPEKTCEPVEGIFPVFVHGEWFPRSIFGKFVKICTESKILWIFVCLLFMRLFNRQKYDVIIVDQVAAWNFLFKLICNKLIFYCHYPDQLLAPQKNCYFRKAYRKIPDAIESYNLTHTKYLTCNSVYTQKVLLTLYPALKSHPPQIIYPCVKVDEIQKNAMLVSDWRKMQSQFPEELKHLQPHKYFMSLNRYEKKKTHERAIMAYASFLESKPKTDYKLVIAGWCDPHVPENNFVFDYLHELSNSLNLIQNDKIILLKCLNRTLRSVLLTHAEAIVYTASNEHFGLVPLEAICSGSIVVGCSSGGLLETIVDKETGFLCPDENADQVHKYFAKALETVTDMTKIQKEIMQKKALSSVRDKYDLSKLTKSFSTLINQKESKKKRV